MLLMSRMGVHASGAHAAHVRSLVLLSAAHLIQHILMTALQKKAVKRSLLGRAFVMFSLVKSHDLKSGATYMYGNPIYPISLVRCYEIVTPTPGKLETDAWLGFVT